MPEWRFVVPLSCGPRKLTPLLLPRPWTPNKWYQSSDSTWWGSKSGTCVGSYYRRWDSYLVERLFG